MKLEHWRKMVLVLVTERKKTSGASATGVFESGRG
jgi:hypothetical protein